MNLPKVTEGKVVFGPCRLSFTHLFERYVPSGDTSDGKYQTSVLIPKSDKATVKAINTAIEYARSRAIKDKWSGKEPKNIAMPLRDGDEKDDENYEGMYYINAKCKTRPGLVDRKQVPIVDEEELYSGVWAVLSVNFYAYDVSGNKGIACGLNNVMKWKDGEFLGGRSSASSDFADIDIDNESDDDL